MKVCARMNGNGGLSVAEALAMSRADTHSDAGSEPTAPLELAASSQKSRNAAEGRGSV